MTCEKRILALCSLVVVGSISGLTGAAVSAAEPAAPSARAAAASESPGIPTRYTRQPAVAAAVKPTPEEIEATKNYYDELFGDVSTDLELETPFAPATAPAAKTPVAPGVASKSRPGSATVSPRPVSAPPKKAVSNTAAFEEVATKPAVAEQPAAGFKGATLRPAAGRIVPAGAAAPAGAGNRVRQAAFDRAGEGQEREFIQQISATDKGAKSAATFPESAPFTTKATGLQTGTVSIEWTKKSDINVGQECELELTVKNGGSAAANAVEVEAVFPTTVRLTAAEPKPATTGERLVWKFDSIAAGASSKVSIKLIPSRRGDLTPSALVRFATAASASFKVEEPLLKVAIKGPSEVMLGDPASQLVTISNPGTGVASDVKIEAHLSDGLEHTEGKRLTVEVGAINAGETRQIRLGLLTIAGGPQTLTVTATSSSDASNVATANVNVIAPTLKLAVDGPALRYKGRTAKYVLTVTNDGTVANNNVRVTQKVADGFSFLSADKGGKFDPQQKSVNWFVGRLEPAQSVSVSCELNPTALGEFTHQVACMTDAGVKTEATAATRVDGTSVVTLEIVDLNDPVEVGVETAYEIRVKNEGSKAASNVALQCELPEGAELLKVEGSVPARSAGKTLQFQPLLQLAAGTQAIFRVHVKGTVEGNHRLRASLVSDSIDEPLQREEQTKFYLDTVQ